MRVSTVLLLMAAASASLGALGCRSKVATLRDALLDEDTAANAGSLAGAPSCAEPEPGPNPGAPCLQALARALGGPKGFDSNDPDQASAGAVAIVLTRDRRGDLVPDPDRWVAALTLARGYGADALRLAVARGMAGVAPRLGKPLVDEGETRALVHELAGVMPGACPVYRTLGAAVKGPPRSAAAEAELDPERSQCVQRDLERKDGPGAQYPGRGVWRAAAGAVAMWKDEARALRSGLEMADAVARPTLERELAPIDTAGRAVQVAGGAEKGAP